MRFEAITWPRKPYCSHMSLVIIHIIGSLPWCLPYLCLHYKWVGLWNLSGTTPSMYYPPPPRVLISSSYSNLPGSKTFKCIQFKYVKYGFYRNSIKLWNIRTLFDVSWKNEITSLRALSPLKMNLYILNRPRKRSLDACWCSVCWFILLVSRI